MSELAKIVDQLSLLTVIQAAELSKLLEDKWGVCASMPVAVAGPVAPAAQAAEQTEFEVILVEFGDKKIEVIKMVREITALDLKSAKELVDGAPKPVKQAISRADAEAIKLKLEAAGAKVTIK